MKEYASCKEAIQECLSKKRFALAYLFHEEKTMNLHIHDCCEIYYSISGGRQFLIGDKCYDIEPGDLFVINNYESHYLSQIDDTDHKRIVLSVAPECLQRLSSDQTNLSDCFYSREGSFSHRLRLSAEQQERFLYLTHKITGSSGFGSDLTETAAFLEIMVMINGLFASTGQELNTYRYHQVVGSIIDYINQNITERITISTISEQFYLSEAYICRLFKAETGTTINKYLTARRISIAKVKLAEGCTVSEACELSGFRDYTNFVQMFTRIVGLTPKRFSKNSYI